MWLLITRNVHAEKNKKNATATQIDRSHLWRRPNHRDFAVPNALLCNTRMQRASNARKRKQKVCPTCHQKWSRFMTSNIVNAPPARKQARTTNTHASKYEQHSQRFGPVRWPRRT